MEINLNKLSFWLCWTVVCLGLGYAWAGNSYLKRITAQEKLINWYQTNQMPEVWNSPTPPADKVPNRKLLPKDRD